MEQNKPQVDLSKLVAKQGSQEQKEIGLIPPKATKSAWRAVRLHKIIKANGSPFLPNKEGIYEPKTEEEAELLAYFAAKPYPYLEKISL